MNECIEVIRGPLFPGMGMTTHPTATGTTETTMVIMTMTTTEDSMDDQVPLRKTSLFDNKAFTDNVLHSMCWLNKKNGTVLYGIIHFKMPAIGVPKTHGEQSVSMTENTSRNIQGAPTQRSTGEEQYFTSMKVICFA